MAALLYILVFTCLAIAGCSSGRSASKSDRGDKPVLTSGQGSRQTSAAASNDAAGSEKKNLGSSANQSKLSDNSKSNLKNGDDSEGDDEEAYSNELAEIEDIYGQGISANRQGNWDLAQKRFEEALERLSELTIDEEEFPELHTRENKLLSEIADELKITLEAQGNLGTEASITAFLDRFRNLKNFEALKAQLLPQALTRPDSSIKFDVPIPFNDRVADALAYLQTVARKPFAQYLSRSSRYLPLMRRILKEEGVPQDLVYLPLIESGFNPHAYSYAHAVGTWQFIASTGRLYDLTINYFVDERRDFVKSSYAAAAYLGDLFGRYNSWELALAAYNGGPGRIERAIKRQETNDFWEMKLRQQTENYVPLFAAAVMIAKEPKKYGFGEVIYEPPLDFDTVVVKKPLELSVVSRLLSCSVEELKELNPQLVRGVTPPGKFVLRVPVGKEELFWGYYDQMPRAKKMVLVRHKIRRGESLAAIAGKYGTTLGDLIRINRLRKGYRPRVGRTVLVPAYVSGDYLAEKAEKKAAAGKKTYKVRRGDNLAEIAARFGVTVAELKQVNKLSDDVLSVGRRLIIPLSSPALAVKPKEDSSSQSAVSQAAEKKPMAYRVKKGDSLWDIGQRFGVTVKEIMDFNNLSSHILAVGMVIRIPI